MCRPPPPRNLACAPSQPHPVIPTPNTQVALQPGLEYVLGDLLECEDDYRRAGLGGGGWGIRGKRAAAGCGLQARPGRGTRPRPLATLRGRYLPG